MIFREDLMTHFVVDRSHVVSRATGRLLAEDNLKRDEIRCDSLNF